MPPFSTRIEEEGVLIDNFKLVEAACLREPRCWRCWPAARYPSRNPQQNMADLKRADRRQREGRAGAAQAWWRQFGLDVVQAYMRHVQDNAEESVRRVITKPEGRRLHLPLDNGARSRGDPRRTPRAQCGAPSTSPAPARSWPNNFNAPSAVCMAAVLYVFRTLVDDDIPLNAGCLKPLKVIIPEGSMLNPRPPASVVAGNVETSTCITNALYGALGVMAAGQCTMNNFTFGNARHQYYETISGGGSGVRWRAGLVDGTSGRADPHDQFTPHGPRGAGVPLSGAASRAATAAPAACASSRR